MSAIFIQDIMVGTKLIRHWKVRNQIDTIEKLETKLKYSCKLQGRTWWAKPLFGLTIYLFGGFGYPTLGCPRLKDPMQSLFSLFLNVNSFLSLLLFSFPQNCILQLSIHFSYF